LCSGRQCHCREQRKQNHQSSRFFHAFCRSSPLGQSQFQSPPLAVLSMEGLIKEQSCPVAMLRDNLKSTVALRSRQGIASHFLPAGSCNACLFTSHLVTVEMRPNATRMALSDASASP
jgi:hypothetical protein